MGFKDHFSDQSAGYARYRPGYPDALFRYLADRSPARALAWDCGCGSGQAAVALAGHFSQVVATDPSAAQLARATRHPRVRYLRAETRVPALASGSVSLVTAAQALHWFDLDAFYPEVSRVLEPGGLLAVWCYGLMHVDSAVDEVIGAFYRDVVGPWWPPERRLVEEGYAGIPFPWAEEDAAPFAMKARWACADVLGYLGTWSATRRCAAATGEDPVAALTPRLAAAWGSDGAERTVTWPLSLRLGRAP